MERKHSLLHDLYELAKFTPDADDTRRAMERAESACREFTSRSQPAPSVRIVRLQRLAVAVAVIVGLLVAMRWLSSRPDDNLAFAEVQKEVEKTNTVQYTQIETLTTMESRKGPKSTRHVMVRGNVQREEVMVEPGDPLPEGEFWAAVIGRYISISDPVKGKLLSLDPEKKTFHYVRGFMSITEDGKIETEKIKPVPRAAFYEMMRHLPLDTAKRLPDETINGKRAIKFYVEESRENAHGKDTFERTYWVDPDTKLPIRSEHVFHSTNPMMSGRQHWLIHDIVFDKPLDESLFSTDPPKGYTDAAAKARETDSPPHRE